MHLKSYVSRVDAYLAECDMKSDADGARESLITKTVDDDVRALWLAGVHITLVFLRLALVEIFNSVFEGRSWSDASLYADRRKARELFARIRHNAALWNEDARIDNDRAFNSLDAQMLVDMLGNFEDERVLFILGDLLDVKDGKALLKMLGNIAHLEKTCSLCVPYYRMRGFEPLTSEEVRNFYVFKLPVNGDSQATCDTAWTAHAALMTVMRNFPFGREWMRKAFELLRVLKELSKRHDREKA